MNLTSAFTKLRAVLHGPSKPLHPFDDESFRARDESINRDSTPSSDEHIDLRCIWGIEFYTPSDVAEFEARFHDLGWGTAQGSRPGRDPVSWLRGLRRHRYGAASFNMGPITAEHSPTFLVGDTYSVAHLPPGVSYAHGRIHSLSPSLIAISVCFFLEPSFSTNINDSLRKSRVSYLVPVPRGYSIIDPYRQKSESIAEIRGNLQESIADWFSVYLPGVFSRTSSRLPTCELLTAKVAHPFIFGESTGRGRYSYLGPIGFDARSDSWKTPQVNGMVFNIPRDHYHANLAVNVEDLEARIDDSYGPPRTGSVHFLSMTLDEVIVSWAILPLLEEYTREISTDSLPDSHDHVQSLNNLRTKMMARVDVAALTTELRDEGDHSDWTWAEARQFVRVRPLPREEQLTLGKELKFLIQNQATWLNEMDRATREYATQYGTLLAATENTRIQRGLNRLTWSLAGLAIVAIGMPIIAEKCL